MCLMLKQAKPDCGKKHVVSGKAERGCYLPINSPNLVAIATRFGEFIGK